MQDSFIEHNGIIVKFVPDEQIKKDNLLIGQFADNLGRRMRYYEVRHNPDLTDMERMAMIRHVKNVVKP